jgi:hypothetical protein
LIRTIITVNTATFAAASASACSASRTPAKTAAMATQAFGFATPSSAPPPSEGAAAVPGSASGDAVAT